ncbi:sugar ABC transporter permease [Paraburkholderia phosphatilytica]|uniref:sugar ABC transporter permease n=1 Tax=Paraburkholderia phosphatilytica TaxID=2282883 RepID=UPI001F0BDD0A|nr:sugar ABC transporter permease [Paraburkholderia phosphatilytica]
MSASETAREPLASPPPPLPPPDSGSNGQRRARFWLGVIANIVGVTLQIGVAVLAARSIVDPSADVLAGLPSEVVALPAAQTHSNTGLLLLCLAINALAAVVLALGTGWVLPARYRQPKRSVFAYLWVLYFAVPFGGLLCTLGSLAVAASLRHRDRNLPIERVEEPEFSSSLMGTVSYGRGARLKAELQNADASTSFRMTALLAMQSMPVRTVSPLLQSMLADPLDDIRLLAYGILDSREKLLTQRILAERAKLDGKNQRSATGVARRRANKALAELYSELIYENLVTGDVYRNAADQADAYASAALADGPDDASLWRLRGRLALDRRDLDAAETLLQRAIDQGFPRERMLPYLAEAAYLRRQYARVRELLAEIGQHGTLPTMRPVLEFWHPRATPAPAPRPVFKPQPRPRGA